jgi:hypothetical protein
MTITTYEEGVAELFNLTLKIITGLNKQVAKLNEEQSPENAKILTKIAAVIPKVLYALTQLRTMQKEIEARAPKNAEEHRREDLIVLRDYLNKILAENADITEIVPDSIAA